MNPKADPTELFTLSRAGSRPSPVNIVPKDAVASEPRKVDEPSDNTLGAEAQPIMDSVLIDYKVLDLQSGPSVTKISRFPVFTPVQRKNNADLPSGRHHSSPRQVCHPSLKALALKSARFTIGGLSSQVRQDCYCMIALCQSPVG